MIRKTIFMMEQPVFSHKIHSEVAVKIHGFIHNALDGRTVNILHDEDRPNPYSIAYLPPRAYQEPATLVINTFNDLAEEIPAYLMRYGYIHIAGAKKDCGVRFVKTEEYDPYKLPLKQYQKLTFLTPATYRNAAFSCWFDPDKLLRTQQIKMKAFLNREIVFDQPLSEQLIIDDYYLRSKKYKVNGSINGMIGNITFHVESLEERRKLCEMLSFCEFAGIGAKTALGMGACTAESSDEFRHFVRKPERNCNEDLN